MNKIVSRLRSSPDQEYTTPPFSARYDEQSSLVLASLKSAFGESNGHFSMNRLPDGGGDGDSIADIQNPDISFKIDRFLFEYDLEYLKYVDGLFGVIVLPLQQETQQPSLHSVLAPMSLFDRRILIPEEGSPSVTLYPVINELIRWARFSLPPKSSVEGSRRLSSGSRCASSGSLGKMARRRSKLGSVSMRIVLSAPVIISALRQTEAAQSERAHDGREPAHGGAPGAESEKDVEIAQRDVSAGTKDGGRRGILSPRLLGGLAKDELGRVHLLQVPEEALLQVRLKLYSSLFEMLVYKLSHGCIPKVRPSFL